MKKLIYIAFAALAALTACTKVEMDNYAPQRKVTFQVASYAPQTKANSSMWTLGSSPSFTAKAFLHAEGYTGETQDFFGASGETITPYKNDGSAATAETNTSYWGPSHDYYWPKSSNSYINFIAWRGETPATATETSLSWTDYTVQSTDDLVYADEAWHYNVNTTNASQYTDDAVISGVPMLFHHALARVAFKANATNVTNGDFTRSVAIRNFSLSTVYNTGSLAMTNEGSTDTATVPWTVTGNGWTTSGTAAAMVANIASGSSVSVSTTVIDLIAMQTVLPQAVTNDMMLSINYDIVTTKNSTEFSVEHITYSKKLIELVPVITSWEMGHEITYTLVFDLTTDLITIQPTIETWEYNGGNVTVE